MHGEPDHSTSTSDAARTTDDSDEGADVDGRRPIYVTTGLLDVLLDMSEAAEPDPVSVVLTPTPAGEFDADLGIGSETPVLTHFYLPDAGQSVTAVFGLDLSTPAGRGRARFHAHPQGPREPTKRDDFAAAVLVAVPPWDRTAVRAYDRSGSRLAVREVDAVPPEETLDGASP
ncbi:hypothetical protein [Salinigranum sp. GCM10025319]|uniref:hypothetical protein n=1 Tax=Salinigranum sp. GCM10025319 TaxID=3252687 RepID=UPI003613A905